MDLLLFRNQLEAIENFVSVLLKAFFSFRENEPCDESEFNKVLDDDVIT